MSRAPQQFATLDALRGVAAIGVMVFHAPVIGLAAMPGGFLAVDLFFAMSGFVIAQAYRPRMVAGMAPREFLWRRAIRLWPMCALGALLGMALHGGHAGALLLLPDWRSPGNLFPANPPLWSLLFEALAYAAFACGLWRLRPRALAGVVLGCAAVLVWLTLAQAPLVDQGAHWPLLGGGLARIGLGFGGGMLAWHWWQRRAAPPRRSWLAWLPLAGMAGIMALASASDARLVLAALFLGCPLTLWAALRWDLPAPRLARALADLSYPLYCIHAPLLALNREAGLAMLAALPIAALLIHCMLDEPARRWLGSAILPKVRPASA